MKTTAPLFSFPLLLTLAAVILCGQARATTLAEYKFTSGSAASTDTADNGAASAVTTGNGNVAPSSSSGNVAFTPTSSTIDATADAALLNNYYIQFTLSPDDNYGTSLNTLTFKYGGTSNSLYSYTANFFVQYSLDGTNYINLGSTYSVAVAAGVTSGGVTSQASLDLSAVSILQSQSSDITFRIYAYGSDATGYVTANRPRLDDITVDGTFVSVPEPSSVALLASGILMLVLGGRKFSRS